MAAECQNSSIPTTLQDEGGEACGAEAIVVSKDKGSGDKCSETSWLNVADDDDMCQFVDDSCDDLQSDIKERSAAHNLSRLLQVCFFFLNFSIILEI